MTRSKDALLKPGKGSSPRAERAGSSLLTTRNSGRSTLIPVMTWPARRLLTSLWRAIRSAAHRIFRARRAVARAHTRAGRVLRLRPCFRVEISVPTTNNAKRPFEALRFEAFQALLTALVGGHRWHGPAHGEWRDDIIMTDDTRQYVATFAEADLERNLQIIHEFVRRVFEQRAVCIEISQTLATDF